MCRTPGILIVLLLLLSCYSITASNAHSINMGDPETHSDYYWYGNMTIQHNESLNIINEVFFLFGRSIAIFGNMSIQNSTLILNDTQIEVMGGLLLLKNSTIEGNGSISLNSSIFRSENSTLFKGYNGSLAASHSSVYLISSYISGQSTSKEFNYTTYRYYNDSYQPGGKADLSSEAEANGYAYKLDISVEYEYANTSNPAALYVEDENESQYLHLNGSKNIITSNFTILLDYPSTDPVPEIYVDSNESDLEVYGINVLAIANDTYYLFGPDHFDLYLKNSTLYSVASEFELNGIPLYLNDGLLSPEATGIYLYHSKAYIVSSGSWMTNITQIPFISFMSEAYYYSAVNITYMLDDRTYNYSGQVYYADGEEIGINTTACDIANSVYHSASVHIVPVWLFNGTMQYDGNYEIDIYNRTEYFSCDPFPDMGDQMHKFVGSVTLPQVSISLPYLLYTGVNETINITLESTYANVAEASIEVYLVNNTSIIHIFNLSINDLRVNSPEEITVDLGLDVSPGEYQIYYKASGSGMIFSDQYRMILVEDHVNVLMHWIYHYIIPFHRLYFELMLFDASSYSSINNISMQFISEDNLSIWRNITVEVDPLAYCNETFLINSTGNLTSIMIRMMYNRSMMNYIQLQSQNITLLPVFDRYDVNIAVYGMQIYPINISLDGSQYTILHNDTVLALPNGTYSVVAGGMNGYHVHMQRSFVVNGTGTALNIYISRALYTISFISNLKSGFNVSIDQEPCSSNSVSLPNGTYVLVAYPPPGYDCLSQNIKVSGSNMTIFLNFKHAVYSISIIINGSAIPQEVMINDTMYTVSAATNVSLDSGVYTVRGLNSTYLRTDFNETIDLLSNTTLYMMYYRPYSRIEINALGYNGSFSLQFNSSQYIVHSGSMIKVPFGFYAVRAKNVSDYSEIYGDTINIKSPSLIINITFSRLEFMVNISMDRPAKIVFGNMTRYGQNISVLEPAGIYYLSISRPGYYPLDERIIVDSNLTLNLDLTEIYYRIAIESNVYSFTIVIGNSTFYASGNNLTLYLPYGKNIITLLKHGYSDNRTTIYVSGNDTVFLKMHRLSSEVIIAHFIRNNYQTIITVSVLMVAAYLAFLRHLRIVGRNGGPIRRDVKR
ncbi:hypothetical protein [Thermoplasma sp.]|uniref:hypothetical protein n=1 Tax=Thermoplasma sp. TaxID=1973142 RepID=UPI00127591E6|nr:hypothetical protein [Thermoplasma sp.]KAA8923439.1 MAG: hypothetical protein F6Q11_00340 [Thermoplasma sp.]